MVELEWHVFCPKKLPKMKKLANDDIVRVVTRFLTEHGVMFEVLISLLLRSTPFTIFSGSILFRIRKRWKV